jgi:hypothetical protein
MSQSTYDERIAVELDELNDAVAAAYAVVTWKAEEDRKPRRGIECEPLHTALRPFGILLGEITGGAPRSIWAKSQLCLRLELHIRASR